MELLCVNGQSIKFVDRKLWKRDSFDRKLNLERKIFTAPSSASSKEPQTKISSQNVRRKCPIEIEYPHKRRILRRPKPFKNYYSDRKPLSIPRFSFPRFGEPFPFRGRQTLCKYYDSNEILNEQLLRIKSAKTVDELERIFNKQLQHCQGFDKSVKSVEPYYDIKHILSPLKPYASETCLCAKDIYRLNETRRSPSPTNAINRPVENKSSLEDFVHLAIDCYDKCVNIYLDNLNDCNQQAECIKRQSLVKSPSGYIGKRSLKPRKFNDHTLVSHINKLNINLEQHHQGFRQSTTSPTPSCSNQTMSCNDTNNNSTESTNQLKDPPKIILSDHSSTNQSIQGDTNSDNNSAVDKNCLTIPIENYYASEARPP